MGKRTGYSEEVDQEVWGEASAETQEKPKAVGAAHVHEWTQISPRKRKCKPCGAVEVSDAS